MIADYETNVVYFSSWLEKEYPKIYIDLVTVLKKNNVAYDIIPCTNDIWCRDYMPVQIDEDRFLCYRYYPDAQVGVYNPVDICLGTGDA